MKELRDAPSINYMFWLFQTIAMMVTGWIVPGLKIVNPLGAILMVVALAFVNAHIWDAALFFEIPDSLTARTLAVLLANGIVFWVLVKLLPWIEIRGCLAPIVAPVIFTVLSLAIGYYGEHTDWAKTCDSTLQYIHGVKQQLIASKP